MLYLDRLKGIHLFKEMTDADLLEVAQQMEVEGYPAGEVIFRAGQPGEGFYVLHRGQVKVTRPVRGVERPLSTLVPGDYFGALSIVRARPHTATASALTEVEVLRLSREAFEGLIEQFPQIKLNLAITGVSRDLLRRSQFEWLNEDEVVYLVARRHLFELYRGLAPWVLGGAMLLVLAGVMASSGFRMGFWIWTPLALADFALLIWFYLDWGNDFYIVTNQRVVWLEKIIALYDSRQEAPLRTILSVSAQTDLLGRQFDFGDVVIRTFTGAITFRAVPHPRQTAALVEEHWSRTRKFVEATEQEAMKDAIRVKIGFKPEAEAPASPRAEQRARQPVGSFQRALGRLLQVRFEAGNVVIYRKHWFVLFLAIGWQTAVLLLLAGLVAARLGGTWQGLSLATVLLVSIVVGVPTALWWLYEYVDWRNDVYQVTPDQIVALRRRPLATEVRLAASLENVLSLEYERLGILGPLLNFGSVVALVGATPFRFDGVFDPVGVQQDVYRRIEAHRARKAEAEAAKRREEIASWLGVYHSVVQEQAVGTTAPPESTAPPEAEPEERPEAIERLDYDYP